MVALSCTKDAQDAILADPELSKVVDIIDIRYWHYNTKGLWAPEAGKNLAPRQFMRKMKVGKTGFAEAYNAVKEYRTKYPEKAVTFFSQQYPQYGWAILMAGGSCPNVAIGSDKLLTDLTKMSYISGEGNSATQVIGNPAVGYVIYAHGEGDITLNVENGNTHCMPSTQKRTGKNCEEERKISGTYTISGKAKDTAYWLERL